ncbi:MAG: Imm49 family immunity protein [Neisseria sp.]|uniref:Imm49 family immunity protein n=1 Tax=Neisseria sp. TaxID=192066 RepID=UPI0026DB9273|nr:Imm49 family immunity protein [Neisseria sp.]MDO4641799.1 Imm49 family immunity protein [Neisseria sp.]
MMNNIMSTKKWHDYIVEVITSKKNVLDEAYKDKLPYVEKREGVPLAAMENLNIYVEATASYAYLFEKDLKKFKQYAYISAKLNILSSISYSHPCPFFFHCGMWNVMNPMFLMLMSDSPQIKRFLLSNINEISNPTENFIGPDDLNRHMIFNTLLMLENTQVERLKQRSLKVLEHPTPSKSLQKKLDDYRFFLAFAEQDIEGMKKALEPFFIPKIARAAAKETLSYFDFYLQPQIVMYSKLASMHGFDLEIDHEIAPKDLIVYDPLPEEEYRDIFDFMKKYDLSYPYEYLQYWIDYYTRKTNHFPPKNRPKWLETCLKVFK